MPPHDGLVPVMKKICKWYEFSGLFSHLSNNITSFGTLISRWGKYSWIFSFSRLGLGSSEESGSPPRGLKFIFLSNYGNVHLIVHPSEIKLRHFQIRFRNPLSHRDAEWHLQLWRSLLAESSTGCMDQSSCIRTVQSSSPSPKSSSSPSRIENVSKMYFH